MRTLLDFVRPTQGSARILGMDSVEKSVAVRRLSTYLPGELVLPPRLSGYTTLRRFMFARDDVPLKRVQEVADRLGLDLSRKVGDLSKGNKQKLGLVLAFAPRARLLILDEPTSGLDPFLQREFAAMVREATDSGATVLLSSHVMSEVEQVATRVALCERAASRPTKTCPRFWPEQGAVDGRGPWIPMAPDRLPMTCRLHQV